MLLLGRTCNQATTKESPPVQGAGLVAMVPLEPIAGDTLYINVGTVEPGDVIHYDMFMEGVRYELNPAHFTDMENSEVLVNITHFIGNESIRKYRVLGFNFGCSGFSNWYAPYRQ